MDNVSAANAAMSRARAAASVEGTNCRECGARAAWVVSKRTGKSYLADVTTGVAGKVIPAPHKPHFKTCGDEMNFGITVYTLIVVGGVTKKFGNQAAALRHAQNIKAERFEIVRWDGVQVHAEG